MSDNRVRKYAIWLCDMCIEGIGPQCNHPECALCRHAVDLPIHRELLEELTQPEKCAEAADVGPITPGSFVWRDGGGEE